LYLSVHPAAPVRETLSLTLPVLHKVVSVTVLIEAVGSASTSIEITFDVLVQQLLSPEVTTLLYHLFAVSAGGVYVSFVFVAVAEANVTPSLLSCHCQVYVPDPPVTDVLVVIGVGTSP
jgi:hypothetical protein